MATTYNNQPSMLDPSPAAGHRNAGPPQTSHQKSRSRTFSFGSNKSHKSSGSQPAVRITPESHAEKESRRLHSKADPTLAMNEAEPSAVQATVKSSITPLRSLTHRDNSGNPISEPDMSNPTRYRWERPLDTIRSFEAAIDGAYSSRKSVYHASDNESVVNGGGRRNSYFAYNNGGNSQRFPQDSYYGGRQSYMPSHGSQYDLRQGNQGRDSYYNEQQGYNNGGRQRYSRMNSAGPQQGYQRPNDQGVYPTNSNHRSYETVASGTGSGSSGEPAGYQTDPTSSDNSSIERMQSPAKNGMPRYQQGGAGMRPGYPPQSGFNGNPSRPAIQLSGGAGGPSGAASQPPRAGNVVRKASKASASDKRKSWFSRKFTKGDK